MNAKGVGAPAQTQELVEILERGAAPDLELDLELRKTLVVRAGCSIRVFVPIKGRPTPAVTWAKDDGPVPRAVIDSTESFTMLIIPESSRIDAGKYVLTLENASGKKSADIHVRVLDSPGPPLNLKPVKIDKDSITLQWEMPLIDGGARITNYVIEKRESTRKAFATVITKCNTTSVRIGDLGEGCEYYFRVSAENDYGIGEAVETPDPIRASQAPTPPESIIPTEITKNTVSLAWTKPKHDGGSRITGYVLEAQKKGTDQWAHVTTVKAMDFTVKNLNENEEYIFHVMAVNLSGRSAPRESKAIVLRDSNSLPEFDLRGICQKTIIAKAGEDIKVEIPVMGRPRPTVTWQKDGAMLKLTQRTNAESTAATTILSINECNRDDSGVYAMTGKNIVGSVTDNIIVKVHDVPGPPKGPLKIVEVSRTHCVITWDPPTNDGEYMFRVSARNEKGTSDPRQIGVPVIVKDLVIAPVAKLLFNTFTVLAGEDLTVEIPFVARPKAAVTWVKDGQPLKRTTRVNFDNTDTLLKLHIKEAAKDDVGCYRITLSNTAGETAADISIVVLDKPGQPGGPVNIEEVTSDSVTISWNPPEYDGGCSIKNYIVERRDTSTTTWNVVSPSLARTKRETSRLVWTVVDPKVENIYLKVTKLLEGNEYIFRVKAVNQFGVGAPLVSVPVMIKDPYLPPGSPKNVEVSQIKKDSMVLTWEAPSEDGGIAVKGYIIEKHDKEGVRWTRCNRATVTDLTFRVTGLLESHIYEFRVSAENSVGVSEPSSPTVFYKALDPIFRPGPPHNPRVTDTTKSSVFLSWGKPACDGGCEIQGYVVEYCTMLQVEAPASEEPVEQWTMCTPPTENQTYKFRVCAINKVGVGEHADISEAVVAQDKVEEPDLDIDPELRKIVTIKAGASLRLFIPIKGRPTPTIRWDKDEAAVKESAQVEVTSSYTSLVIDKMSRNDSGKYTVTAENSSGTKTALIVVRVLDTPSPPTNLMVKEITNQSVTLAWEPPLLDGGSKIKNYVVEKRESTRKTFATVANLNPGQEYLFRVTAINDKGKSDPRVLAGPVMTKDLVFEPDVRPAFSNYSVHVGKDLNVEIPIYGRPKPTVTWSKDGAPLKFTTRVNIVNTATHTKLSIKEAASDDGGMYSINVANAAGKKDATLKICRRVPSIISESLERMNMV
uniref:Titin n=1 Tax=Cynoglossus semilaevis TaxID=244447 RepID=A0A3P8WDN6_CYNSE